MFLLFFIIFLFIFLMGNQCDTMIMWKGRGGFSPNTLNNQIFTYAITDWWREQNDLEKIKEVKKEKFTSQSWIQFLVNVHDLHADWGNHNNVKFQLFDDWSIYGDGLFLTELQAIAIFNPKTDDHIRILKEQERFLLTEKFGANRAALSDHDTDIQLYSKFYGLHMNIDEELMVKYKPSSSKNINLRTSKSKEAGRLSASQAEWTFIGQSSPSKKCQIQHMGELQNQYLKPLLNKQIFLKLHFSRYNQQTKVAQLMGYLQDAQYEVNTVDFQGWRQIVLNKSGFVAKGLNFSYRVIRLKSTQKGLLVDFSNAVTDSNTEDQTPSYPLETILSVKWDGKVQLKDDIDEEKILRESAGIIFYHGMAPLPKDTPIEVSVYFRLDHLAAEQEQLYQGIEAKYVINTDDASKKADIYEDVPYSHTSHRNTIDFDFFCSSYGKPVNGDLELEINQSFVPDSAATDNYSFKSIDFFKKLINERIDTDKKFRQKYKSFENIQKNVYNGILPKILEMSTQLKKATQDSQWKNKRTGKPFELRFVEENGKRIKTTIAKFVNGHAKLKIALDEDLTPENNPRSEWKKSQLGIIANLKVIEQKKQQSRILKFCMVFFENEKITARTDKIDWIHDIGPYLRSVGLIYPVMQNIVDLYNFKKVHLLSMKRCFDVQDENDPKYMPNTRQISKILHRKIRRWLYHPLYNKDAVFIPSWKMAQKHKAMEHRERLERGLSLQPYNFNQAKENFVSKLKGIWHVEFFTIPVYLSCQFTAPNKATRDLIASIVKDQMKHLFIVSNILNAIHDQSLHPGRKAVPFDDQEIIPRYPSKPNYIFETNNPKLKSFLTFDILPCTPEQILKLICVQLPTQTKYLHFKYIGHPETGKMDPERVRRAKNLSLFIHDLTAEHEKNPDFRTIGDYYGEVMDMLWDLSDMERVLTNKGEKVKLFSGDPKQQFTYYGLENMSGIYDLRSTLNQLRLVVEEGEGGNLLTLDGGINKESHFLKFIQIYMMSSVQVKTRYEGTDMTQIVFEFQDDEMETVDDEKLEEKWTPKMDKEVDRKINIEFLVQRESSGFKDETYKDEKSIPLYPSVYAKPGFKNAYEKVVEQLDLLFNTKFKTFKQTCDPKSTEQELWNQFEDFRRKTLELSISKMKQMRIQAFAVIRPEGNENKIFDLGSRPNYNLDFEPNKPSFEILPKKEE